MRVLITFVGGAGHLDPLLPLARAVAAAGHTVAIAGSGNQMPRVQAQGFTALPTSPQRPPTTTGRDLTPLPPVVPDDTEVEFAENFAGKGARGTSLRSASTSVPGGPTSCERAVTAMLADTRAREAALALKAEIDALPSVETTVPLLEQLALH